MFALEQLAMILTLLINYFNFKARGKKFKLMPLKVIKFKLKINLIKII